MRQELSIENTESFLKQFNNLHDAFVQTIRIEYKRTSIEPLITLLMEAKDWEAQKNTWVNITIELEGVTEYRLTQDERYAYTVKILKADIRFFNGKVCLYLVPGEEDSPYKIVGKKCFLEISPLSQTT